MSIQLFMLATLILLNAFFAATEIAFITINDAKIEAEAKSGDKKFKKIKKILSEPSKFLATIQIGITLAGFLSSAFAANTFAEQLAGFLFKYIPLSMEVLSNISIVLVTIILSYFSLVFGELVPKRIAMKYSEPIAKHTVKVIHIISIVFAPFIKLLTFSTNILSKIFGISPEEHGVVTEEEIRMMVSLGQEKGAIKSEEKELINNVFEFNDKAVSEIMIHRKDIYAIEVNSDIMDVLKELKKYKYSRIPVYEDNVDNIIGIIFIKDLLEFLNTTKEIKISDIIRGVYFVPETKIINDVFREMQKSKHQIAIVLDEYGGTAGLITMEDIIEEIVR